MSQDVIRLEPKTKALVGDLRTAIQDKDSIKHNNILSIILADVYAVGIDTTTKSWNTYMLPKLSQGEYLDGDDLEVALQDYVKFDDSEEVS